MYKILIVIGLIGIMFLIGCYTETADDIQARQTEKLMEEATNQIGMPNIVNFQQKKLMKMIYELCDKENLICYAYLYNALEGKIGDFIGKCFGYGLPFSAQYSNPEVYKQVNAPGKGWAYEIMPQPEPNGLFMPTSSSATWLIMVDPKTSEPRVWYVEPQIIVSPYALHKYRSII